MGVRQRMTHRAATQRNTPAGTDGFGGPGVASWAALVASQPCWVYAVSEDEIIDGDKSVVLGSHKILMPKGLDITESDRITSIVDRAGTTIIGNTMRINSVVQRHSHIELAVTEVKDGE